MFQFPLLPKVVEEKLRPCFHHPVALGYGVGAAPVLRSFNTQICSSQDGLCAATNGAGRGETGLQAKASLQAKNTTGAPRVLQSSMFFQITLRWYFWDPVSLPAKQR